MTRVKTQWRHATENTSAPLHTLIPETYLSPLKVKLDLVWTQKGQKSPILFLKSAHWAHLGHRQGKKSEEEIFFHCVLRGKSGNFIFLKACLSPLLFQTERVQPGAVDQWIFLITLQVHRACEQVCVYSPFMTLMTQSGVDHISFTPDLIDCVQKRKTHKLGSRAGQ